nr:hypothetical protein [Tanacetum cinerariifolium]
MVAHAFKIKDSMSMLVQKSQDHKMERLQDNAKRLCLVNDLKKLKITFILHFMPDDNLVSLTGFETLDFVEDDSKEELLTLNTEVDQLESNISKKVTDDIQSSIPSIVDDGLNANFPGLFSEALKNTLPRMFKDSIQ